jgi:hypothetical protein
VYMSGLVSQLFRFLTGCERWLGGGRNRDDSENISARAHGGIKGQYTLAKCGPS